MALDEDEERAMWDKGILGVKNPFSVLFCLWYHITLLMGLCSREEHRNVMFGDITIQCNGLDVEFLQFQERLSNMRDWGLKG